METFENFITANADADTARLLLSNREWPVNEDPVLGTIDSKDLAINTIETRKKLMKKIPSWTSNTGLVYPTRLCGEQCSSEKTASYKAALAERIISGRNGSKGKIADLTGGLGVDSHAFASVAKEVFYNEIDPALAAAASHNFHLLGADNILVNSSEVAPGKISSILGDFNPDIIFMDPARRDSAGKKVFLLEDCSPDVLKLIPELFEESRNILLKLSPMADLTMVVERLNKASEACSGHPAGQGRCVREVHVTAWGGECKELLVWMDREYVGRHSTVCCEDGNTMRFEPGDESTPFCGMDSTYSRLLFEPGKSLSKAAMLNEMSHRLKLAGLARFTHLFVPEEVLSEDEAEKVAENLARFGKVFRIIETVPFSKAALKDIAGRYPHSEVSARNIPMSSDELRKKLKVTSGDDAHIFGVRIELPSGSGNHLIVCKPFGK